MFHSATNEIIYTLTIVDEPYGNDKCHIFFMCLVFEKVKW